MESKLKGGWGFLTGVSGLQTHLQSPRRAGYVAVALGGAPGAFWSSATQPGISHRPLPRGHLGLSSAFHVEPKWEGLWRSLLGSLQQTSLAVSLSWGSTSVPLPWVQWGLSLCAELCVTPCA